MPKAHLLHLDTIAAKLRACDVDPLAALEACAAGEAPHGDAVYAGLEQVRRALGDEACAAYLRELAPA